MAKMLKLHFTPVYIEQLLQVSGHEMQTEKLLRDMKLGEEDDRLLADYILSLLENIRDCGASHNQTAATLNYFINYMKNTCNSSLIDAVRTLQRTIQNLKVLTNDQLKYLLEFINKTYFQHYNLYKYILTTPQEQDYTSIVKDVMIPDTVERLESGVEESQWKYEEQVANINQQHTVMVQELEKQKHCPPHSPPCKLNPKHKVHHDSLHELIVKHIQKQLGNVEYEVQLTLQMTELIMAKEVALIEAAKAKNSLLTNKGHLSSRSSPSRKSPRSSPIKKNDSSPIKK